MSSKEGWPLIKKEAESKKIPMEAKNIIKGPYVLEFLDLKANTGF